MSEGHVKYARVTISIPEELLATVDAEAIDAGMSRSGIIQEASARYVTERRGAAVAESRRLSVEQAIEGFRRARQRPMIDERPTLEILRELRDRDDFPPGG